MNSVHNIAQAIAHIGHNAKVAARQLAAAPAAAKVAMLEHLATLLMEREDNIMAANAKDMQAAADAGMDAPRQDRLRLTHKTMCEMADACRHVAGLADPIGAIERQWQRPNGLLVGKMRIPLGVIAMIYESRPNVTIDSAILCLKAGNAVILRGGSEAIHSNIALAALIHEALTKAELPAHAVQVVPFTDREAVTHLCHLDDCIDVIIPRGGERLIRAVVEQARMPVLKHYKGVCHAYIDQGADLSQALEIIYNGKVQRPGVCNALEGLLVNASEAEAFLPQVADKLGKAGVTFRACEKSLPLLAPYATAIGPDDRGTEYHDLILLVQVVESMDEALDYIAQYGSNHSEIICTQNHLNAMRFMREADASMVAVNASTRFNDGGQLGLGAEIGICTSKLHSYGAMGVEELTTTKFVVFGTGQVRE
ncbi:MAG: glutamate-5-semialdehyde dehydrogenase [Pseudomonadota bacterium]